MVAQTNGRTIARAEGVTRLLPVKGATTCYQGGIAVMDGSVVKPGVAAASLRTVGVFEADAANPGADAAVKVSVVKGTFKFANHATNVVTAAHIESPCYIEDDQTVGSLSTTRSIAGTVHAVDPDGVWVRL